MRVIVHVSTNFCFRRYSHNYSKSPHKFNFNIGTFGEKTLWRVNNSTKLQTLPKKVPGEIQRCGSTHTIDTMTGPIQTKWRYVHVCYSYTTEIVIMHGRDKNRNCMQRNISMGNNLNWKHTFWYGDSKEKSLNCSELYLLS